MAKESNALRVGYRLEEYRIETVLGAGGFGITYKALDTNLETWVAIKEYFPVEWSYRARDGIGVRPNVQGQEIPAEAEPCSYDWGLNRFLDEARVLARVKHNYVVRVTRYFKANGSAYFVMDYQEGEPLSTLLQREVLLSEPRLRILLREVLQALQAVHAEGYLHRDLKPSNLYIRSHDNCTILIDFGAARQALVARSKTLTGLVTPGYSPPEQYATRSDRYGPWTDIYSLGAVLYRCISGEAPVEAPDRQMWDTLVSAKEIGEGSYDPNLLAVVDRALAMRPEDRYRSVAEMWGALKASDKKTDMAPELTLTPMASAGEEMESAKRYRKGERQGAFPEPVGERSRPNPDDSAVSQLLSGPLSQTSSKPPKPPVQKKAEPPKADILISSKRWRSSALLSPAKRPRLLVWALAGLLVVVIAATATFVTTQVQETSRQQRQAEEKKRKQETEKQNQADQHLAQARQAIAAKNWGIAMQHLDALASLQPGSEKLKDARAELEEAQSRRPYQETRTQPTTGMELVLIKGGCFDMGSPQSEQGRFSNEQQKDVCVTDFWLSKHEVTNAQYKHFKPAHSSSFFNDQSLNKARQPVVSVSWKEAVAYAEWLSDWTGKRFRLPTEAEWEYAARAGTQTAHYWGNDSDAACDYANVNDQTSRRTNPLSGPYFACDDGHAVTAEVGSYKANKLQLYDMLGNVKEWTCSEYARTYNGEEGRCSSQGTNSGRRVLRGGSWDSGPDSVRSADRTDEKPELRSDNVGFRLIQEP